MINLSIHNFMEEAQPQVLDEDAFESNRPANLRIFSITSKVEENNMKTLCYKDK